MKWLLVLMLAQEAITLTTPIANPAKSTYEPVRLALSVLPQPMVQVTIRANDGVEETFMYPCKPGECSTDTPGEVTTLITALNTANLTTRSLWRRVFDRLVADFPSRFPGGATVQ